MWKCKHCSETFQFERNTEKANHSRHCDSNPKKKDSYSKIGSALKRTYEERLGKKTKFDVECHGCGAEFQVEEFEKQHPIKDKYYCSRSCANSVGGKAKSAKHHTDDVAKYTTVAWRHHEKCCIICGETKIVAVHHFDEDHSNNDPKNLVPMCPTHHQYMHSRYKFEILDQVVKYIKTKWGLSVVGGTLALQA